MFCVRRTLHSSTSTVLTCFQVGCGVGPLVCLGVRFRIDAKTVMGVDIGVRIDVGRDLGVYFGLELGLRLGIDVDMCVQMGVGLGVYMGSGGEVGDKMGVVSR